ncbi:MAG: lamin tail domain-containing protein [Phycisphaerae bacterium]|nr:lamin tail domain-containing protein [Phycisphaerae bacterium]
MTAKPLSILLGLFFPFALSTADGQIDLTGPVINEFLASNASVAPLTGGEVLDADGDSSDWIELYNPTPQDVDLGGWSLADDPNDLTRWQFPDGTTIAANGYLLVFASGKDLASGQLHTNFRLSSEGGYLALVMSDERTVAHEYANYPAQLTDISYGLAQKEAGLVTSSSTVSYHVPTEADAGMDWTALDFDDDNWPTAEGSLGLSQASQLSGQDIGSPSIEGGYAPQGASMFMVFGSGADIGGTADSFHYVFMPLQGDGELVARVVAVSNTHASAKAGVMIRESLAAGSRYAMQAITPGGGTLFQRRTTTNGTSVPTSGNTLIAPYWVRIIRRGSTFAGYHSPDGVRWTQQGSETISMAQDAYIGLCVTSHAQSQICGGVFNEVSFSSRADSSLTNEMLGRNASLWTRVEFDAEDTGFFDSLLLSMRYEDGFVAWLNGREVARGNVTGTPLWNSAADSDRGDALMHETVAFDLSAQVDLLREGRNVLAVQGLNDDREDPVLFLAPELVASGQVLVPQYFGVATPGRANSAGALNVVAGPRFSPERGLYTSSFSLALSCDTADAVIRYTTDGSAPTEVNGQVYSGPISVSKTTCVRAAAFRSGWMSSSVETHTYILVDQVPSQPAAPAGYPTTWSSTQADYQMDPDVVNNALYKGRMRAALMSLPTMSIVTTVDDLFGTKGIYSNASESNRGVAWERGVSVEWINTDGTTGFQVDAGLRIYGGAFRGFNLTRKKSLRLLFKREYGPTKLNFRVFEEDDAATSFDTLVLRAGANDAWNDWGRETTQYIVDEFMRRTQLALGQPAPHGTFVHLYLNGLYWGLYNVTERPIASFCATYFGGDEEEWDAINDEVPVGESNLTTWNAMIGQVAAGLSSVASYQKIQGNNPDGTANPAYTDLLDVDNYIDYMFSNFWGGTGDWPGHNYYAACRRPPNSTGFKFFNWDSEGAIVIWSSLNANVTDVSEDAGRPYAALRQNPEFCLLFADHMQKHLFNGGPAMVEPSYARYKKLADEVELAIITESARWGDQSSSTPYTLAHWTSQRDYILNTYMRQRPAIVLTQLKNAGLYPTTAAPVFLVDGVPQHGGGVDSNSYLAMSAAIGTGVYYTTDGSDPRLSSAASGTSKLNTLLSESASKRVLVPSVANGGNLLSTLSPGFTVTYYKASGTVDSISAAETVIASSAQRTATASEKAQVINYFNTGSLGHFDPDRAFPGTTMNVDVEDFVILVTGKVLIPQAGDWTFGVNSDDGYSMTLKKGTRTYTSAYPDPRGPADTLTVLNIAEAGAHDLRLVFYERGGGSELELFAARGSFATFSSTRFRLVGDVANGGLQVGDSNVWYTNSFDDSSWRLGAGGVGYDTEATYTPYFNIDVRAEMYNVNGSCYIRIPFVVGSTEFSNAMLKVRYDDGFIAWLNGVEVARRNFMGTPAWNSVASTTNADSSAVQQATVDISDYANLLWKGTNLLAIQALNNSTSSSDLLFSVELVAGEVSQGAVSPTALTYTGPILLTQSTRIKARALQAKWSALSEAVFAVGPVADSLRVSEILYDPADTGDPTDPKTEYIELTNVGTEAVNLNLVQFTKGIDYTFGSFLLPVGGYCLLVKDIAAFEARYGTDLPVVGQYGGSLNNSGERIEFVDAAGVVIQSFEYDDDWFDLTDGIGFSLTVRDPRTADAQGLDSESAWRPSVYSGGSPGADDSGLLPDPDSVVINELLANSSGGGSDWIELYNTTDQSIDLSGWYLSDDNDDLMRYRIAEGTVIPAGGYLVFYETLHFDNEGDPGCLTPFGLSKDGETVYLISGSEGVLTGYSEQQVFGASDAGVSLGRWEQSDGSYVFVALMEPTPGAANAEPAASQDQ